MPRIIGVEYRSGKIVAEVKYVPGDGVACDREGALILRNESSSAAPTFASLTIAAADRVDALIAMVRAHGALLGSGVMRAILGMIDNARVHDAHDRGG